jgi:uncharacterized glyoxalase superfamily protein PhnB
MFIWKAFRHRLLTHCITLCLISLASISIAEDRFEGAVWEFELKKTSPPTNVLTGRYRVSNHILFQKDNPGDKEYTKQVGRNNPNGNRTTFVVDDFRAFTRDKKQVRMKGTGKASLVEFGKWTGTFTDRRGVQWQLRLNRIEE